ncbi:MAG: hypothetical protein RR367_06755 [Clostridia bacterium]
MKWKLSIGACVLISLALVVFGLLFGTVNGYADDRRQVTVLLEGENGLKDVLSYRGADGLNLCVVASRHLSGDADVAALKQAAKQLSNENIALEERKREDAKLDAAVNAVKGKLVATKSFTESARDQKYLDMLTTDMQNLQKSALVTTYNTAAKDFNAQLETPVIGAVARLMGIMPCELYE